MYDGFVQSLYVIRDGLAEHVVNVEEHCIVFPVLIKGNEMEECNN